MKKTILIAFDDSDNSMRAVEFVGAHFSSDFNVVLFCVFDDTESLYSMNTPELSAYFLEQQDFFGALKEKQKKLLNTSLERTKETLINCGFHSDSVTTKLKKIHRGVARDIIHEANKGDYNMIALGRRGLSGIKEFFLGSVSQKVLHGVRDSTFLIID